MKPFHLRSLTLLLRQKIHIARIREWELRAVAQHFPQTGKVLDFGAGTGDQSIILQKMGYEVFALDVDDSDYSKSTVFPVKFYDGKSIPFPDNYFDFIFSSNVLEHIRDMDSINHELKRVLKPESSMFHVVPSATWRFWTSLTMFFNAPILAIQTLFDQDVGRKEATRSRKFVVRMVRSIRHLGAPLVFKRHGEWGNAFTEVQTFGRAAWNDYFIKQDYKILHHNKVALFYTGASLFGMLLSMKMRSRLADIWGGACHFYIVQKKAEI